MYRLTVDGDEHYVVAMRNVFSNHLATHRYTYILPYIYFTYIIIIFLNKLLFIEISDKL